MRGPASRLQAIADAGGGLAINPQPRAAWRQTRSIELLRGLLEERMYPLTLEGLDAAIDTLS